MNRKITAAFLLCVMLAASLMFYLHFANTLLGGDAIAEFYPAKVLNEKNSLNLWDDFNTKYDTFYFKLPFTDEVIVSEGKSYPATSVLDIYFVAGFMKLFGDNIFYYLSPLISIAVLALIFLICYRITESAYISLFAVLFTATFPLYIEWSIVRQNIMELLLFFVLSVYSYVNYTINRSRYWLSAAALFYVVAVFIKPTMITVSPVLIYIFYRHLKQFGRDSLPHLIVPSLSFVLIMLLANWIYFGDPLYFGLLKTNYHPVSISNPVSSLTSKVSEVSRFNMDSIRELFDTIKFFMLALYKYSPFHTAILLFSIVFCFFNPDKRGNLLKGAAVVALYFLPYFLLKSKLWTPANSDWFCTLDSSFFRYLLPVLALLPVFAAVIFGDEIKKTAKPLQLFAVFSVVVFAMLQVPYTVNYKGGASLAWLADYASKTGKYRNDISGKLVPGSTVYYPQKIEMTCLSGELFQHHWFYYEGIPPDSRISETIRITRELLRDKQTVYIGIYEEPYLSTILNKKPGELNIADVVNALKRHFDVVPVKGSAFPRMRFIFAEIKNR